MVALIKASVVGWERRTGLNKERRLGYGAMGPMGLTSALEWRDATLKRRRSVCPLSISPKVLSGQGRARFDINQ
jgi:hypothetical protein